MSWNGSTTSIRWALVCALLSTLAGCDDAPATSDAGNDAGRVDDDAGGGDAGPTDAGAPGGEHVALVRGTLNDPSMARTIHDTGAAAAEAFATSLGDEAHIVGLGASVFASEPTGWIAIDRWASPDAMNTFYGSPDFEAGLSALVHDSSVEQFRRQTTWHGWGSFDAAAGEPRWYVLVRARFIDASMGQAQHDAGAAAFEAAATAAGDVAHLAFTGRDDDAEFLAIDIWTDPDALVAFYSDPRFGEAAAAMFVGTPTLSVYHATNWHQWGSVGRSTLDGSWRITSFTCGGAAQAIGDFIFEVRARAGTFVQTFDPSGCVATYDETYDYTAPTSFEITAQAIDCDPSSSCMAIFGASCLPAPPPTEFDWSLDADTLTFTRTATGPGDLPCSPGDAVEFVMDRVTL